MPRILEKEKVLGGRGVVFTYSDRNIGCYFYRERVEGTKKYRTKTIQGASNLKEAVEMAMEVAIALRDDDPHHLSGATEKRVADLSADELLEREEKLIKRRERLQTAEERLKKNGKKSILVQTAIDDFNKQQYKRVKAGTFAQSSYEHKMNCLKWVSKFLKNKGVTKTSQIKETTFEDYVEFRSITTRITIHRELAVLGEWIKSYLVRNKYINSDLWLKGNFLPRIEIRMTDRMANPAINAEDWKVIVNYVRDTWCKASLKPNALAYKGEANYSVRQPEARIIYWRHMFWHYILFSKNTGMSPEEVLKLKWKSVEIRDVGRISQTKMVEEVEELEAEGIEVVDESEIASERWVGSENALGREERLVAYITTIRSKTKQPREIPCNQGRELRRWLKFLKGFCKDNKIPHKITGDDYVFANPLNEWKPPHQNRIGRTWRLINRYLREEGKLKGHKFSDHNYTLYSMRSTFIEDHLIKGTDIFLLARIAGHDVKTLMQSYERMDIRKRAEEITSIEYGVGKTDYKQVNLLEE